MPILVNSWGGCGELIQTYNTKTQGTQTRTTIAYSRNNVHGEMMIDTLPPSSNRTCTTLLRAALATSSLQDRSRHSFSPPRNSHPDMAQVLSALGWLHVPMYRLWGQYNKSPKLRGWSEDGRRSTMHRNRLQIKRVPLRRVLGETCTCVYMYVAELNVPNNHPWPEPRH